MQNEDTTTDLATRAQHALDLLDALTLERGVVSDPDQPCHVCILGALLIGEIRGGWRGTSLEAIKVLEPEARRVQLEMIEMAFEGHRYPWHRYATPAQAERATAFGSDARSVSAVYRDPQQVGEAILRNIIENDGRFVP